MVVVLRSSDVFACAKTRHQPMYMDVHWLMRYLYPLFSKALVLFRSVNNIYAAAETHLLLIIARECASFRKLFISSISTYINSGWFFYRHRYVLLCNGCRLSLCACISTNGRINLCTCRVPMQQFSNGTLCSIVACLERFILSGSNNVT